MESEEPNKIGENLEKSQIRDEKGRFVEGHPDLGAGRPLGVKNFDTLFEEAIRKIVAEKKLPIDNPEIEMAIKAIIEALKGNYPFWRDLMDRRYGKPKESLEVFGGVLPFIIKIVKDGGSTTTTLTTEPPKPTESDNSAGTDSQVLPEAV